MAGRGSQVLSEPPDGGWGWVIVAAVFLTAALTFGTVVVYPLFYLPLMNEFEVGLGEVTWLTGSIEIGRAVGYLIAATLVSKLGFRWTGIYVSVLTCLSIAVASISTNLTLVYVLMGTIPGIGVSICGTIHSALIPRYFKKKRVLALGLAISGSPVGTLVLAPLLQFFIDLYGWRGGMLLLGGLTLNCAVAASLFRPIRLRADLERQEHTNQCAQLLKSAKTVLVLPKYWIYTLVWLNILSSWLLYLRFLVPYSDFLGVDPMMSSALLSVYSGVGIFARITFGALGDIKRINIVWVLIAAESMAAVISAAVWFVDSYAGLLLNSIAHSIMTGGMHSMYTQVLSRIVGDQNLAWGYTLTGLFFGVIGSWVTPLVGMLVDSAGDVRLAFLVSASMVMLAVVLHVPLIGTGKKIDIAQEQKE